MKKTKINSYPLRQKLIKEKRNTPQTNNAPQIPNSIVAIKVANK